MPDETPHGGKHLESSPTRRKVLLAGMVAAGSATGAVSGESASAPARDPQELDRADTPVPTARSAQYPMSTTRPGAVPPVPWKKFLDHPLAPGLPERDYKPVFTPNGATLPFRIVDGWKVFHLVAEPIVHRIVEGLDVSCWGYNGRMPGPTIEAVQGDRVRVFVTNRLNAPTSVHWHAIILPNGMDGVSGITQPHIQPGETFQYEFIFPHAGTFMYHPHFDNMTQEGMGLAGMLVVHPRDAGAPRPDRDFAILLHEWFINVDTYRPDPFRQTDFNVLTMNGKVLPGTYPLVCQLGDHVRIRWGNLSAMDHHPIHLHGYAFRITATDGGPIPREAQWPETTVLVHIGSTRDIEFFADNPGDWVMHCHMTHHTMNQMGHDFVNPIMVDDREVAARIRMLIPQYMTMGKAGMGGMAKMNMRIPGNSIPMLGVKGQFDQTVFGGMATVVKVREHAPTYEDPGWYDHPEGSVARAATPDELKENGVDLA